MKLNHKTGETIAMAAAALLVSGSALISSATTTYGADLVRCGGVNGIKGDEAQYREPDPDGSEFDCNATN